MTFHSSFVGGSFGQMSPITRQNKRAQPSGMPRQTPASKAIMQFNFPSSLSLSGADNEIDSDIWRPVLMRCSASDTGMFMSRKVMCMRLRISRSCRLLPVTCHWRRRRSCFIFRCSGSCFWRRGHRSPAPQRLPAYPQTSPGSPLPAQGAGSPAESS